MNYQPKPDTQDAAPVTVNDVFSAHGNTPLVIAASQLTANDTDGSNLEVISVDNASPGITVSLDWTGNIIVTTDADYSGPATFDYTVDDGQGGTSTAQVTVNVAPIQRRRSTSPALKSRSTRPRKEANSNLRSRCWRTAIWL